MIMGIMMRVRARWGLIMRSMISGQRWLYYVKSHLEECSIELYILDHSSTGRGSLLLELSLMYQCHDIAIGLERLVSSQPDQTSFHILQNDQEVATGSIITLSSLKTRKV